MTLATTDRPTSGACWFRTTDRRAREIRLTRAGMDAVKAKDAIDDIPAAYKRSLLLAEMRRALIGRRFI